MQRNVAARRAGERTAIIVTDLGFGDAGKGSITDALVRRHGAGLVVRYNGGAQAAHAVVTDDGREHVFHQFGSGTFVVGVETFLSRFMLVNPLALFWEERQLRGAGVTDAWGRLYVDDDALVTTPYHVAANRLREWTRGDGRHGSCGLGIGETAADALEHPARVPRVRDLRDPVGLREKLLWHRGLKRAQMAEVIAKARAVGDGLPREIAGALAELSDDEEFEAALEVSLTVGGLLNVTGPGFLGERLSVPGATVFEGAQGVLLDEWRGFHPYTTWSTTTPDNARTLLAEAGFGGTITTLGLLRAYMTRHGAGPFPTEDAGLTERIPDRHNGMNPWQRAFRVGWLDLVALRYALAVSGGVDALAVTCLDRLEGEPTWRVCDGYRAPDGTVLRDLAPGPEQDLAYQERLTELLTDATPIHRDLHPDPGALVDAIAAAIGVPVGVTSYGPTAADKRFAPPWAARFDS